MTKQKKLIVILGAIVLLGAFFRLYRFPELPNSVNRDEAALGYNAYTILKTGKDEWEKHLPIVFKSFGDYKLAGYIYTLVPFVGVLGLTPLAVRLPSLLAGCLLPLAVFFLVSELTRKRPFALLAAAVTAVAPWAIFYSRVGFEANLALLLFVTSLALFLRSMRREKPMLVFPAALLFFLSLLTYNTPLLLAPFFIILLLVFYRRKAIFSSIAIATVALASFVLILPAIQGKSSVTLLSDVTSSTLMREQRIKAKTMVERIESSRLYFYGTILGKNYVVTFLPDFLVIRGGVNPWHEAPYAAHFTWSIYVLAILGILIALKRRKKQDLIFLAFLLISPIPSAITVDAPHATRSLFFFITLCVFAAYALTEIWNWRKQVGYLCIAAVLLESGWYLHRYLAGFVPINETQWNMNVDVALEQATQVADERHVPVTLVGDANYSYILPLFFRRVDPNVYWSTVVRYPPDILGLARVKSYGNYRFVENAHSAEAGSVVIQFDYHGGYTISTNAGPIQTVIEK